jgi:hypothetical protein
VSERLAPAPLPDGLDIPAADWQQTLLRVRVLVLTLLKRLEVLETRLHQDSSNSSRPSSTDALVTKRHRRMNAAERRKPGAKPAIPGINTLRQRVARLVREALSCSKTLAHHIGAIKLFICHYNLTKAPALHG